MVQITQTFAKRGASHGAPVLKLLQQRKEHDGIGGAGEMNGGTHECRADGLARLQKLGQFVCLEACQPLPDALAQVLVAAHRSQCGGLRGAMVRSVG